MVGWQYAMQNDNDKEHFYNYNSSKPEIIKRKFKSKNRISSMESSGFFGLLTQTADQQQDEKLPSIVSSTDIKKTILQDHGYIVGKQIGSGSYAKVKIAFSDNHKCRVAIKIIPKYATPSDILRKFVPREIEVVKGLRHENLIKFYQSIETTHRYYIIMEYAVNGSLLDYIRKVNYLKETVAQKYFKQLISVLEYCHSRGIVHRDVKCENLLLDKNFNLKLIDFGFARGDLYPRSSLTSTRNVATSMSTILSNTFCGSYAYASPEILKGIPYEPQLADIWASGVVLYAIVFGRLPFDDTNYKQLIKQVESKILFPKNILVTQICKNLIKKILAPLEKRYRIAQIKLDDWIVACFEKNVSNKIGNPVAFNDITNVKLE